MHGIEGDAMKPWFLLIAAAPLWAMAATPSEIAGTYAAGASAPASAARGRAFFTQTHGRDWSCASCHGDPPTRTGQHATTSKPIDPLAPAFNPARFSDPARVEKWLRRNCNDVAGRECTPQEKADVTLWLTTLKP
jgi:hypothetical protein